MVAESLDTYKSKVLRDDLRFNMSGVPQILLKLHCPRPLHLGKWASILGNCIYSSFPVSVTCWTACSNAMLVSRSGATTIFAKRYVSITHTRARAHTHTHTHTPTPTPTLTQDANPELNSVHFPSKQAEFRKRADFRTYLLNAVPSPVAFLLTNCGSSSWSAFR